ncbi:hypothetical protein [Accumulibacter sp.]|uniref:hypothetical protein n=1 Tax=Candidatus Accumulibacter TaxID=327159 RepID=UPI00338FC034|nr:diheme cytochrome c [Candidatus Accumulibacter phosphatis]
MPWPFHSGLRGAALRAGASGRQPRLPAGVGSRRQGRSGSCHLAYAPSMLPARSWPRQGQPPRRRTRLPR